MTSTLTARLVPFEDYLKDFCLPQFSERKYLDYIEDHHPHAKGVVISFGDYPVKHWLELEAFFKTDGRDAEQEEKDFLDRLVAESLATALGAKQSAIPVMAFLGL